MAHVMELEINGEMYPFKAGFAFIREVDPLKKQTQNGVSENVGLNALLYGLHDGDTEDLLTTLFAMNKGEEKRLTKKALEEYIENTEDIDKLFATVLDFLSESPCVKKKAGKAEKYAKIVEAQQEKNLKSALGATSTGKA